MSFLKKLFGLGGSAPAAEKPAETQDYKGFKIAATPFKDGGQWQLCGVVSLEENGVTREHRFIRNAQQLSAGTDDLGTVSPRGQIERILIPVPFLFIRAVNPRGVHCVPVWERGVDERIVTVPKEVDRRKPERFRCRCGRRLRRWRGCYRRFLILGCERCAGIRRWRAGE